MRNPTVNTGKTYLRKGEIDEQHTLKKFRGEERSDPEGAENGLGPAMQLMIGRSVVIHCPKSCVGERASEHHSYRRHFHGFLLDRCSGRGSQSRRAWNDLAAGPAGISRYHPRVNCAFFLRCHGRHHGASSLAANGRLHLFLAWRGRKRRRGSQDNEEQNRHDFGEESHASAVRVLTLSFFRM